MANLAQPQVVINYISQRKKIIVNRQNQPSQLIIQTDYNLNETYNFQVINAINQVVELDSNTTYQLYGSYIDAKSQVHILFYTLGVTPVNNTLSFLVNTYNTQYRDYVKTNRTPIEISIVAKQNVGGTTKSYMVLRDSALANPRGYVEGQAPTDIVYRNVFNSNIPVSGSFGAGNDIDLAQDLQDQGVGSFAFGDSLTTSNANQFVIGSNNDADATKAFIIANSGNIFTVDYEGNVEANAISASAIYVNGEDIGQSVDGKVDELSTAFDNKLSATEDWVSDTFETKESATQTFNELEGDIDQISSFVSGLPTDIATKANQTDVDNISAFVSGLPQDINDKFNALTGQTNYLSGQIDATNLVVNQVTGTLDAKANKTDLEALSGKVEAIHVPSAVSELENDVPYLSAIPTSYVQQSQLEDYALKSEIPVVTGFATKAELSAVDNKFSGYATTDTVSGIDARLTAVENAGYITNTALEPYAKTSAVAETYATKNEISSFITESAITGLATKQEATYTGSGAITVENNVISLTGELGKTYYADETTLQLNDSTNTFSIKSLDGKIEAGNAGIEVNTINGVTYISNTGSGGGGGSDKIYSVGVGLSSANVTTSNTQFFVDQDWLSTFVENATSDIQNLSAGTGLQIVDNVISVSAQYLSAVPVGYATESWVEQNFLSSVPDTYATKDYVTGQVSGKADLSAISDMATQTWVENQHYITSAEAPSTVYFAGDGLKLEDSTFSLTATVSDIEGYDTLALKTDLNDLATEADLQIVSAAIPTSYVQPSAIAEMATTGYVQQQVSGKASQTDLEALSTQVQGIPVVEKVSDLQQDIPYISAIPTSYVQQSDLEDYAKTSAITGLATKAEATYTGTGSVVVENNVISLTGELGKTYTGASGIIIDENDVIGISANFLSANALEGYATQQWVGEQGFALTSELPTVSTLSAGMVEATSATIRTGLAKDEDLQYVSGVVSAQAGDITALKAASGDFSNYYTKSEVYTKLETDSAIETATSGKADKTQLTAYALSADVYNKTEVYTKTEADNKFLTAHQSLDNYYNKTQVNAISSALSTTVSDANYQNATQVSAIVENMSAGIVGDYATKALVGEVSGTLTGQINDLTTGQIATNTSNIQTLTGKVNTIESDYTTSAQVSSIVTGYNYITGITLTFDSDEVTGSAFTFDDKFSVAGGDITINVDGIIENYNLATISDIPTDVATSAYVTGCVNDLATGAVATNTTNIGTLSTDLGTVSGKANTNETNIGLVSGNLNTLSGELNTTSTFISGKVSTLSGELNTISGALSAEISGSNENIATLCTKFGDYYTSAQVNSKLEATSTYIDAKDNALSSTVSSLYALKTSVPTSVFQIATAGSGVYITEQGEIGLTWNTIPSAVSQLINDVGFVTETGGGGTGLEYYGGYGISVVGAEISLTATIPTGTAQLTNTANFITSGDLSSVVEFLSGVNVDISQDENGIITLSAGTGGGSTYTEGAGIDISDQDVISIDQDWLNNHFSPTITNKKNIIVDSEVKDSSFHLVYNANKDIFVNTIESVDGVITINQVSGFVGDNGQVACFEHWIKADGTLTGFVGDGVELVNVPSSGLDATKTQVFTRRIVKVNDVISQYAVWEYQFSNTAVPTTDKIIAVTPQDFTFNLSSDTTASISYEFTGENTQSIGFTYTGTLPDGINFSNGVFSSTGSQMVGNGTATIPVTISALNAQNETLEKTVYCNLTLTGFELVEVPNQEFDFTYNTNATSSVLYTYHGNQSNTVGVVLTGTYTLPAGVSFNNGTFTCVGANLTGNTTTSLTAVISGADVESITTEFDLTIADVPIIASNQTFNFDFREANQTSALTYTHLGSAQVNVSNANLPNGISYANGYFTATSAANVTNGTTAATTTISADDADSAIITTTFNLIGAVTETITAPASSFVFDFENVDDITSTYVFTYTGNMANLSTTVTGLPEGITSSYAVDGHSGIITLSGSKDIGQDKTFNVSIKLEANDAVVTTASVSIEVQNSYNDPLIVPLTFKAIQDNSAIRLSGSGSPQAITLKYSKNGGPWTNYSINGLSGQLITLNNGDTVAFSGNNSTFNYVQNSNWRRFAMTGAIEASGNIMSLINFSDTVPSCCFVHLFNVNQGVLRTAPLLPATNLGSYCYFRMFRQCSNLVGPIVLPATTLANNCYQEMFDQASKIGVLSAAFTDWNESGSSTYNWLPSGSTGTFYCPTALNTTTRDASHIPTGWTIVKE